MLAAADDWNRARQRAGEPRLGIGVGMHYGPVVTGDIGSNRLELAVIGATVNIASRLEAQTRVLSVPLLASADLVAKARDEIGWREEDGLDLEAADPQMIRGVAEPIRTFVLGG
jgi:adenylate cyclase